MVMHKSILKRIKDESGNTFIEASFIMTISLIVLLLLILFGFIFYQESLLQTVADDTARRIASTYTYEKKDPVTGYITTANLRDQGLVDSMYYLTGERFGKDIKEEKEGKALAKALLNRKRLRACQSFDYSIDVRNSDAVLFQKEVVVTLEEKYSIPFLKMLGVNNPTGTITRKYSSKALCFDYVGAETYYSTLSAVSKNIGNLQLFKAVQYVVGIVTHMTNGSSNLVKAFFEFKQGASTTGSSGGGHGSGGGRLDNGSASSSGTQHGGGGGTLGNNTNGGSSTSIGSSGAAHGSGGGRIG